MSRPIFDAAHVKLGPSSFHPTEIRVYEESHKHFGIPHMREVFRTSVQEGRGLVGGVNVEWDASGLVSIDEFPVSQTAWDRIKQMASPLRVGKRRRGIIVESPQVHDNNFCPLCAANRFDECPEARKIMGIGQ